MKSQKQKVLGHLLKRRRITTAQAARMGVGRLSAVIERLRQDGHKILHIHDGVNRYYDLLGANSDNND